MTLLTWAGLYLLLAYLYGANYYQIIFLRTLKQRRAYYEGQLIAAALFQGILFPLGVVGCLFYIIIKNGERYE